MSLRDSRGDIHLLGVLAAALFERLAPGSRVQTPTTRGELRIATRLCI